MLLINSNPPDMCRAFHVLWKQKNIKSILNQKKVFLSWTPNSNNKTLTVTPLTKHRVGVWTSVGFQFECENLFATGYGTHFLQRPAIQVALAESWERWIVKAVSHYYQKETLGIKLSDLKNLEKKKQSFIQTSWPKPTSTNGFAAGQNLYIACLKAAAELFERYCVLAVWNKEYEAFPLTTKFPFWLAPILIRGWKISLYHLGYCHNFQTIGCLAMHPNFGARFDSIATPNLRVGIKRVLMSILSLIDHPELQTLRFQELWQAGEPLSHLAYYMNKNNLCAFDFFKKTTATKPTSIKNFDPFLIPIWGSGQLPAVVQAIWHHAKPIVWGPAALLLCPYHPHPHPIA